MSYSELLERMMDKDTAAFLEMTDRYGWALYSEIRKKHPSKEEADRIYNDTMQQFYRSLQNPACEDPMEALLCGFADRISDRKALSSVLPEDGEPIQPPPVEIPVIQAQSLPKPAKRKGRFWFRLGMLLVLAGFLAVIWIGVGLLMEAGMLPYYDLGYTWFTAIAARWL